MSVIKVSNLTYVYNQGTPHESRALDKVSFSIKKGEFLGIVGANGSGKSTLIQHMNGMLCPQSGQIRVMGQDTSNRNCREQLWKKVGLVFQFPEQQIFEATVYDELAYGLKNLGLELDIIKQRVKGALASVGLDTEQMLSSSPLTLSGGTRRRVAVASILAMKPDILVLDEPTAGLDPEGSEHIMQTIKKYQQEEEVTVVMVSHCINELILQCDRLLVLDKGRVCAWGLTREVLACNELVNHEILLPEHIEILFDLKKRGWQVNTGVLTVEEAAREIAAVLGGN